MFRSIASFGLRVAPRLNNVSVARCFSSDAMNTGAVKWFDVKKGFGFIVPDDGSEDIFVHQSSIHSDGFRSLADGETVEYSVVTDDNGRKRAENVTGPMGAFVQGAQRSPRAYGQNNFGNGGGFGGGGGRFGDE